MNAMVELHAPERRRVAALAAECERGGREQLEIVARWVAALAHVAMAVHDERRANLGEGLGERAPVVEPHADLGRRALADSDRERHHVVVEQHDSVACVLPRRASWRRSRSQASCSGPMAPFWRKNARWRRAHESSPTTTASASSMTRFQAPQRSSSRPVRVGKLAPPRALALLGRPRPDAARDREQIQVVVARDGEQRAAVAPRLERGLDELPAVPVVGAVSGDDDGVHALFATARAARKRRRLVFVRRRLEHERERSLAGRRLDQGAARRASSRQAFAAARSTGSSKPPLSRALGTGWAYPSGSTSSIAALFFLLRSRSTRQRASSQHVSKRDFGRVGDAGATPDEPRSIVQRVAERGDVQVGDVSEGEGQPRDRVSTVPARLTSRRGS